MIHVTLKLGSILKVEIRLLSQQKKNYGIMKDSKFFYEVECRYISVNHKNKSEPKIKYLQPLIFFPRQRRTKYFLIAI